MASGGEAGAAPGAEPAARRNTIGSVEHAIELLRCLAAAEAPIGTNDLARRMGLHKSSISRLAATLENAGLLRREPATGRFALGPGLMALAAPLFADFALTDAVEPILAQFAARTGETCSFNIWDGRDSVSIAHVAGSNSVRAFSQPGRRKPGHATATGKILLAYLGEAALAAYCSTPLHRYTGSTITDPKALAEELDLARRRGYAVNVGEFEADVGAVASAVLDSAGRVIGSVTATVPLYRFPPERHAWFGQAAIDCAAEIGAHLGMLHRRR
ncbi:IclR family transcriptional regulator [Ancylobacter sp. MQZ15Z-1]|uniref:IclR family transcriptional regulator n=1 Tax=Ancylobacter mangrovi TaxID=2972472 RepID=A0A9X2PG94_9HYPH|nr:IclR family transcriptional regulator [Ancylobacter mangrovi]MCS0495633.1 IclR family transcriptional regulator [Ancylobacter mangrovi]